MNKYMPFYVPYSATGFALKQLLAVNILELKIVTTVIGEVGKFFFKYVP